MYNNSETRPGVKSLIKGFCSLVRVPLPTVRTLLLHKACLPLTSHITMSGLGTGIPVYSRLSISIRISQSELNGDRGLTDPQHSTLTRWQVARRLGSNCVTTVTLLHFNDLFDHHLPGPCGSARGSTLGPGTGLRLTEKGVVWLVGVNYTNKVWFPG